MDTKSLGDLLTELRSKVAILARAQPCFIAGQAKSGTTLLVSLLDSHPELLVFPEETAFVPTILGKFASFSRLAQARWLVAESEARFLFDKNLQNRGNRSYKNFPSADLRELFLAAVSEPAFENHSLLLLLMASYAQVVDCDLRKTKYWVEKTPANRAHLPRLRTHFPNARVLHTLRDPRAVFVTRLARTRRQQAKNESIVPSVSIYDNVKNWLVGARNILDYAENEDFLPIRFEDLCAEPMMEMRKVADFLNIDFSKKLLIPSKANQDWRGNSVSLTNFAGVSREPINRWRRAITSAGARWVEAHCRSEMLALGRLGYKPFYQRRIPQLELLHKFPEESWGEYLRSRRKSMIYLTLD